MADVLGSAIGNIILNFEDRATKPATSAIQGLEKAGNSLSQNMGKWGASAAKYGAALSLALTTPILAAGKQIVSAASDLAEAQSAVNTVFGDSAKVINDFAASASTDIGQSERAVLSMAGSLGALFTGVGLGADEAATFSNQIIQATADLGSFYNKSNEEVGTALRAGLVGEFEGLRRFGIILNADIVEAKALEMGLVDLNGEVTESGKVTARQTLIMEQLGAAQGDFARTSSGLANSQKIFTAQMEETGVIFGRVLLPLVTDAVHMFTEWGKRLETLSPAQAKLGVIIAGIAAAIGPVLVGIGSLLGAMSKIAPVAAKVVSGLKKFPLGLGGIGLAIGAIMLAIQAYRTNFLGFADLVDSVVARLASAFGSIGQVLASFGDYIGMAWEQGDEFNDFLTHLPEVVRPFALAVGSAVAFVKELVETFQTVTGNGVNPAIAAFESLQAVLEDRGITQFSGLLLGVQRVIQSVIETVQGLSNAFRIGLAQGLDPVTAALEAVRTIFPEINGIVQVGVELWNNLRETLAGVGAGLKEAFDALTSGNIGGVFQGLANAAGSAIGGLINHLGILKDGAGSALDFLENAFKSVDWDAVSNAAAEGLQNASDAIMEWVQEAGGNIANWFRSVDWSEVGQNILDGIVSGLTAIRDFATLVVGGMGDLAGAIGTWALDAAGSVEWLDVWTSLGDITGFIVGKLGDLGVAVLNWVTGAVSGINWEGLWTGVRDVTGFIISKLGDLALGVLNWVTGAVTGLDWQGLWSGVQNVTGTIVGKLGDIATALKNWIGGALEPVRGAWDALWAGILPGGGDAAAGAGNFAQSIVSRLGNLGECLGTWLSSAVPQAALDAFTGAVDLARTAVDKAWQAISGFDWAGILSGLPSKEDVEASLGFIGGAFQKVSDTATAVKNWLAQLDWSGMLSGLPTAEDLTGSVTAIGQKFQDMSDTINEVKNWIGGLDWDTAFSGITSVAAGVAEKVQSIADAFGNLKDAAGQKWSEIAGGAGDATSALASGASPFQGVELDLTGATATVPNTLGQQIADQLANYVSLADWTAFDTNVETKVGAGITAGSLKAEGASKIGADFVAAAQAELVARIVPFQNAVSGVVQAGISAASDKATEGATAGTDIVAAIQKGAVESLGAFITAVEGVIAGVIGAAGTKAAEAVSIGTALIENAQKGAVEAIAPFITAFQGVVGGVVQGGVEKAAEATRIGSELAAKSAAGIGTATQTIIDAFRAAIQAGIDAVAGMADAAYRAGMALGAQLGAGVIAGVQSRSSEVGAASGALADQAAQGFSEAAEISSPSKVMEGMGRELVEGVLLGMQAQSKTITPEVAGLFNEIADAFDAVGGEETPADLMRIVGTLRAMTAAGSVTEEQIADVIQQIRELGGAGADAAASQLEDLFGITNEEAEAQAERILEIRKDYAETSKDIANDLASDTRKLQHDLVENERQAAAALVDVNRSEATELRQLDQQRNDAAQDAAESLADIAEQRVETQEELNEQLVEARETWAETNAENLASQQEARDQLAESLADARSEWAEINSDNLEAQREVGEELASQLDDAARAVQETLENIAESRQDAELGFGRSIEDIDLDTKRLKEDFKRDLRDADTRGEKRDIEFEFERDLEDLQIARRRAEEDHEIEMKRLADERREAQEEAARERAALVQEAAEKERELEEERLAASREYASKTQELEGDTAETIQGLEADRIEAERAYAEQRREIRADTAEQYADLAQQEQQINEDLGQRIAEIEQEKAIAVRDAARERGVITNRAAADEERIEKDTQRRISEAYRAQKEADRLFDEEMQKEQIADASEHGTELGGVLAGAVSEEIAAQAPAVNKAAGSLLIAAEEGLRPDPGDVGSAFNLGQTYGQSYADGLRASAEEAREAGGLLAAAAKGGTQKAQRSGSPSLVAMALGRDFATGFALGIDGNTLAAQEAASRQGQETIRALGESLRKADVTRLQRTSDAAGMIRTDRGRAGRDDVAMELVIPLILDGKVLDERIVEVSIGGQIQAHSRNNLRRSGS